MPYSEEECLEKECKVWRMIGSNQFIKKSSESSFFHDYVYYIEENAHKDKTDSGMDFCISSKREPRSKDTETNIVSQALHLSS